MSTDDDYDEEFEVCQECLCYWCDEYACTCYEGYCDECGCGDPDEEDE